MTTDPVPARRRDDLPGVARLLTLSDSVVAIALTLLVLQLKVPPHAQVAHPDSAAASHQQALEMFRDFGHRLGQAEALNRLGELSSRTSAIDQARERHAQALTIARDIGIPFEEARALGRTRPGRPPRRQHRPSRRPPAAGPQHLPAHGISPELSAFRTHSATTASNR